MNALPATEELLSLNTLARKLDISYPHALDLLSENVLTPDFTANRIFLFRPARVPELLKSIQRRNR